MKLPYNVKKKVIADLIQHNGSNITVNYADVQWQSGANDCGLFALAFAVTLCLGRNPASKTYE